MKKGFITRRVVPFLFAISVIGQVISPTPKTTEILPTNSIFTQANDSQTTAQTSSISLSNQTNATSDSSSVASDANTTAPTTSITKPLQSTIAKSKTTTTPSTNTPSTTIPTTTSLSTTTPLPALVVESAPKEDSGRIKVHFINVGQADSIFIELPNNETMLIDAGTSSSGSTVVNYIKNKTPKLTYVVATHPHADHIGGMAEVINSIEIDRFIMPRKEHTTATFEGMVDALIENNVKVTEAKAGVSILDTKDIDIDILGPGSSASDSNLNNSSAIIRVRYKEVNYLFIGDAESSALEALATMNMDVLKVGHHGSDTSSPLSFLKKVDPEYSVVSVGKNSYGHPVQSAMANLNSVGSKVFRTDQLGTIIITSDGKKIEVNKSPSKAVVSAQAPIKVNPPKVTPSTQPKATKPKTTKPPIIVIPSTKPAATKPPTIEPKSQTVYGTATGKKYHVAGCRYLAKSKIPMILSEAKNSGLTACSVCH